MKTFKAILAALLISGSTVFAHGEQQSGPHGGEIRMPGNFHTEVVQVSPAKLKVFLLDMKFQSPTTNNSSVSLSFDGNETRCAKQSDHFVCAFDRPVMNTKGELSVNAIRDDKKGKIVKYATPLKFKNPN